MFRIEIREGTAIKTVNAEAGTPLALLLEESNLPHPCGKKGLCKKCSVTVNGKKELSCRYIICSDAVVEIEQQEKILSPTGAKDSLEKDSKMCLCLDIGSTTLVMALVSQTKNEIIFSVSRSNPQMRHGADIMSRIEYARKNGVQLLRRELLVTVRDMREEIFRRFDLEEIDELFVSGNTTMLHIFFGEDCSSMGTAPYTPVFLEGRSIEGSQAMLEKVGRVVSLPCISAFAGADILAGISLVGMPEGEGCNVLIDLGTNAEISLIKKDKILCTSAAAGPCFEGASISQGMSAVKGAISSVSSSGKVSVIGDTPEGARGICATGLIDAVAFLLRKGILNYTGFLEGEKYSLTEKVFITQEDIRQLQLAKSAVFSALSCLFRRMDIDFSKAEKVFISGGFSSQLNEENMIAIGLIPAEFRGKLHPAGNSSLLGTVSFACKGNDLTPLTDMTEYADLGGDKDFQELFIDNLCFDDN